jgi:hypothetical protein
MRRFLRIARKMLDVSPLRKAFTGLCLLAITYFLGAAIAEQATGVLNPQGPIEWFIGAAIVAMLLFWAWEEILEVSPFHRISFITLAGILIIVAFRHEVKWVMAAADDTANAIEIKEAKESLHDAAEKRRDQLQQKLYTFMTAASQTPPPKQSRLANRTPSQPNSFGGSLSSPDEPSERATLRVMAVKAHITSGVMFDATVYVQNVGKYISLPLSIVRSAVKESKPLPPGAEGTLFEDAPTYDKIPNPKPSGLDWQRGHQITEFQPWYPGDVRSLTVKDVADPPQWDDFRKGDRGWYVLTRSKFCDKLGGIPPRDSCWFFSAKVPNGEACFAHND